MRDAAVKARRGGSHRSTGVRWWQAVSAVVPITLVASAWGIAITATPASDTIDAKVDDHSDHGTPTVTDIPTDGFAKPTFGKVKKHQSALAPLSGFGKKQPTATALKSSPSRRPRSTRTTTRRR
ncbi:hypothetical protein [Solicola gregarius]|uniref:Uncharacterized protein n=1 Tax=Solicola gregarius TaxID=2908642 RepID=A0AA46YMT0_9ACTN|nr:hypothetical protein [Solicola gregarius]UYM06929.1 hypothetical protein L0C25_07595 [Solicola gregarius]